MLSSSVYLQEICFRFSSPNWWNLISDALFVVFSSARPFPIPWSNGNWNINLVRARDCPQKVKTKRARKDEKCVIVLSVSPFPSETLPEMDGAMEVGGAVDRNFLGQRVKERILLLLLLFRLLHLLLLICLVPPLFPMSVFLLISQSLLLGQHRGWCSFLFIAHVRVNPSVKGACQFWGGLDLSNFLRQGGHFGPREAAGGAASSNNRRPNTDTTNMASLWHANPDSRITPSGDAWTAGLGQRKTWLYPSPIGMNSV